MSWPQQCRTAAAIGLLGAVLVGCGGDAADAPLGVITQGGSASAPAHCSTTPTGDPLPTFFPAQLTLPPGAVVTTATERGSLATITGSVPGRLDEVFRLFKTSLESARLPIEREDNEGFEAEYFFGTLQLQGVIRVVEERCLPGRTVFAMSLQNRA